jgi:flagellar biogenesis protein FliO
VELAEQVVSLLAVFGLLAIAVWAFGRKNGRSWFVFRKQTTEGGSILVADRLVLTPQHVLHLVRVGERTLLLATHPHGVSFDPAGGNFSGEFRSAMARTHEECK